MIKTGFSKMVFVSNYVASLFCCEYFLSAPSHILEFMVQEK